MSIMQKKTDFLKYEENNNIVKNINANLFAIIDSATVSYLH